VLTGGSADLGWSTRIPRRTRLSIDTPARHVFVIGVEGRLDAVSGVRLLRLLDTRLTLTSAAAPPTRRVLIDLTGLTVSDSGGVRSVDRARSTAERHDVGLALITHEELCVPSGDRRVEPATEVPAGTAWLGADVYEPPVRALLVAWPRMPGPVIAQRINWPYSEGPLKKLLARMRPEYVGIDRSTGSSTSLGRSPSAICGSPRRRYRSRSGRYVRILPVLVIVLAFDSPCSIARMI